MMDANKKYLADKYPDMVLYVESPSTETIRRFERGEGPLFAARTAEQILVTVTDVTKQAKEKVEELMQTVLREAFEGKSEKTDNRLTEVK